MGSFARDVVAIASALLVSASPASAAGAGGKVAFVSNRDGNSQIYVMNADGSGQRALTKGPAENTDPSWSPDGRWIAFTSYRDGNAEIYVMDADGRHMKRVTSDSGADTVPAWTASGRIVFRSTRGGWTNFYAINADGTGLAPLTATQSDKGDPVVSPDGRWIAYVVHGEQGATDVHVVPASGGVSRDLTGTLSKNQKLFPSWAPDARRLVYLEVSDGGLNIRAIDPDGGNPGKITENAFTNGWPVFSPDGKRIAFVSSREGTRIEMARGDIFVMNADGSDAVNLTHHPDEDNYPAWSADGRSIYFVSLRDGTAQIYAIPAQGGEPQRLTRNAGHDVMIRPQSARAAGGPADKVGALAVPSRPVQ